MKTLNSLFIIVTLMVTGCMSSNPSIVKHPDTPAIIIDAKGKARIAIYMNTNWVEYGWVDLSDYQGWTIGKMK